MEYAVAVDAARAELDLVTSALRAGPVGAPVPTCPGWAVSDLGRHVAWFVQLWSLALERGERPSREELAALAPAPDLAADVVAAVGDRLLGQLAAASPDQPCWTWVPGHDRHAFAAERVLHELTMHRVDAQAARGASSPIDAEVATAGIEEVVLLICSLGYGGVAEPVSLHLHGTDADAEWMIRMTPDRFDVEHEHAKGDLAARGAVGDLERLLYGRPPHAPLEFFGDKGVLDAWYATFTF